MSATTPLAVSRWQAGTAAWIKQATPAPVNLKP